MAESPRSFIYTQHAMHDKSVRHQVDFWREQGERAHWFKRYDKVLDDSRGSEHIYKWYTGGMVNCCYDALDVHVEAGHGSRVAVYYDSPVTNTKKHYTYAQLLEQVATVAGGLRKLGVAAGDRVLIYMPVMVETMVAMLACARIGAIHSVVFGGFGAKELATRINDSQPKVILAASCGIEAQKVVAYKPLLDGGLAMATHEPHKCVILQRPQCEASLTPLDMLWEDLFSAQPVDAVPVTSNHPLYILYTSGTTGQPKGVVRDHAGQIVSGKFAMPTCYGINPGETFFGASDVGWIVGHTCMVYSPLLAGCATVMYEGKPVGTPNPGSIWRVVSETNTKALFIAPTALRVMRRDDPNGEYIKHYKPKMDQFQTLFVAGERLDPPTFDWARDLLGCAVVDNWWQTETGFPMAIICRGLDNNDIPPRAGSCGHPGVGYDLRILRDDGIEAEPGEMGRVVCKLPLPPGTLLTLWNNEKRFLSSYMSRYEGYYETGDSGFIDEERYVHIMSRTDDVINVAAHRLSTAAIEDVLVQHPAVSEGAVVGIHDDLRGQIPLGLVVLKPERASHPDQVIREIIAAVRESIGPVAFFKNCGIVERLPKTRSGKILRRTIAAIADGRERPVPPTIDDPAVLGEVERCLKEQLGYPRPRTESMYGDVRCGEEGVDREATAAVASAAA
ncbi:unnamed protein product [Vitrella brassicaformis CCMP3155]|uniref:Propionate--CoA ligase n=1 Tax=Vitrella brassicaformis (strain CCMP3155) TaxID=1169540 RepID=A0A0G4G461_VITBC|nr:unnamed protein product [Vitrella brassicaformis CCMP3155]|eukprot:CEM23101.1 unnamed protein product [Vitrella brassicaformis CCMP3155]